MMKKTNGDKPGEAKLKIIETENLIKRKLYTVRRVIDNKISSAAILLATACATDANTAYYVKEYNKKHRKKQKEYHNQWSRAKADALRDSGYTELKRQDKKTTY